MNFKYIKDLPRHSRITPADMRGSLERAKEIIAWAAKQPKNVLQLENGQFVMLSEGHAAFQGATLVIDEFNDHPKTGTLAKLERPYSYAFYQDEVICLEDNGKIADLSVHEVGVKELLTLMSILGINIYEG